MPETVFAGPDDPGFQAALDRDGYARYRLPPDSLLIQREADGSVRPFPPGDPRLRPARRHVTFTPGLVPDGYIDLTGPLQLGTVGKDGVFTPLPVRPRPAPDEGDHEEPRRPIRPLICRVEGDTLVVWKP